MQTRAATITAPDERQSPRSRKLTGWVRFLTVVLVGLCLTAVWQERRLSPLLHDGMVHVAGMAMDYVEGSEALSGALAELQKSYDNLNSDG